MAPAHHRGLDSLWSHTIHQRHPAAFLHDASCLALPAAFPRLSRTSNRSASNPFGGARFTQERVKLQAEAADQLDLSNHAGSKTHSRRPEKPFTYRRIAMAVQEFIQHCSMVYGILSLVICLKQPAVVGQDIHGNCKTFGPLPVAVVSHHQPSTRSRSNTLFSLRQGLSHTGNQYTTAHLNLVSTECNAI